MSNNVKKAVINAKDLWTAITNCDQMNLLRKYFISKDIYADSLFHDVDFDKKTGDVTFTVKHSKFPVIKNEKEIASFRLPGLKNPNEKGEKI